MSLQESNGNSASKCLQEHTDCQDQDTSILFQKCGETEQPVTLQTAREYLPTFDAPCTSDEGGHLHRDDACYVPSFQDACTRPLSFGLNQTKTNEMPDKDDLNITNEAVTGSFTSGIFEPLHMHQVGSNWDDLLCKGSLSKEVATQIATASTMRSHDMRSTSLNALDMKNNDSPNNNNTDNNLFGVQFAQSLKGVPSGEKRSRNVKFFSHELGIPKSYPQFLPRPHSDNHLENMVEALQITFNRAKEETDMELACFAVDLVEILDTCTESFVNRKDKVEDLLILVRHCAIMPVCDFQVQCEFVVQELEYECRELPTGLLKELQTRLLFILARCTRLLRLHKEAEPHEIGSLEKLQECLRGLPSYERVWVEKKEKLPHGTGNDFPNMVEKDGVAGPDCLLHPEHRGVSHERLMLKHSDSKCVDDEQLHLICRICEEEVPLPHLEEHSAFCAFADACDEIGLSVNERLLNAANCLEKLSDLENSPDILSHRSLNLQDYSDTSSPKCISSSDQGAESKPNQGRASSSVGTLTPRSSFTTPRTSHLDILWKEHNVFIETDDAYHIHELIDIARCVANRNCVDEDILDYLAACMEDLQNVLHSCRSEAVAVFIFGRRIEDFLREKGMIVLDLLSHQKADVENTIFEDDDTIIEDTIYDLKSTPSIPLYKDRTTINDFEILKPISRGAFGKVFLARKKTTGDLFAIKVLRKVDMIRKNAVESILAERDILISVCNPFVVRFFYSFTCKENLYLVMEYLNGGDLFSLLKNMGSLDEHVVCVYIAELVLALEYLHSLGIVHRDLKPDNILVANDGHIKLTDFGLSKVGLINSTDDFSTTARIKDPKPVVFGQIDPDHKTERINKEPAVGTPDYLAPEILLGKEHGFSADWWSVGIILFECLTGIPPFCGNHPQSVFENILNRKIPWPEDHGISEQAKDLIEKLLIQNTSKRLGSQGAHEVKSVSKRPYVLAFFNL